MRILNIYVKSDFSLNELHVSLYISKRDFNNIFFYELKAKERTKVWSLMTANEFIMSTINWKLCSNVNLTSWAVANESTVAHSIVVHYVKQIGNLKTPMNGYHRNSTSNELWKV